MQPVEALRSAKRFVEESRLWRRPAFSKIYQDFLPLESSPYSDDSHLKATVNWLRVAQDANGDGGVSGRYHIGTGWSASYPETTGYVIPTFLELSVLLPESGDLVERARRMVSYLLRLQMPDGSFPGGEVSVTSKPAPVVFNTGQIMQGLVAWYEFSKEQSALDAAVRASQWLVSGQNQDGSWKKFTYGGTATAYHARVAWPLAQCGVVCGENEFLAAASKHVDWILALADRSTGWVDRMGFYSEDHQKRRALTHTIAYTYRGLYELALLLKRDDYWDIIFGANERLLRRLELTGRLAGVFDCNWKEQASYTCLTGCVQLAGIWMRLYRRSSDIRFLNGALKAIDLVKSSQTIDCSESGINGGVPGSWPIWGDYIRFAFPNWAAKFYIDAILYARDCLQELNSSSAGTTWKPPATVPRSSSLPQVQPSADRRIVLVSTKHSTKGQEVASSLTRAGIKPLAAVVDQGVPGQLSVGDCLRKLAGRLRNAGPKRVASRAGTVNSSNGSGPAVRHSQPSSSIEEYCRQQSIQVLAVQGINSQGARDLLNSLKPDLLVLAGAGILHDSVISAPTMGVLNAHMGVLPRYRGMNVAEWAAFEGGPVGCTVHYVDRGIDTGRILAVEETSLEGIGDIEALRARVNAMQLGLLCRVLAALTQEKDLPPYAQTPGEGAQYFRMHPSLRSILEQRLRTGASPPART